VDLPITQVASYSGVHPKVRYATIQMRNQEAGSAEVYWIDIYNGATYLEELGPTWSSTTWVDETVDLGSYYDMVRGMNMDVNIYNWDTAGSRWWEVGGYGAKAEW
jgi:hypothetical protein